MSIQAGVFTLDRGVTTFEREAADEGFRAVVSELPLRCVWSGPVDGCSCDARIPKAAVVQAWQCELDASGDRAGRFFHFIWNGGVWLAYGLEDGDVRGVYCPSHNSERAARSQAAACGHGDDVIELPLAA
jgi:hypothetical protein